MPNRQLANLFLEQSNDLIWIIDSSFNLIYANQAYQNVMKQVTGEERKMDEPIFTEGFGDGYIKKWKAYFERGLNGEHFEIEDQFYNPATNQVEYSQISFTPIIDENGDIINVACQSRDITSFIKSNAEAEIIMDASLDVICSIDEQGFFKKVNAACKELWGYEKHELVGKAYIDFVIDEDLEKTNAAAAEILSGKNVTTFENRYKRKDGGIAFNLWSAKWDPKSQIMFGVARDGREKIKKEELLIESENRFKALVQEGSDLIAILDEAGIYKYVSPTSMRIVGMQPEEFIGKNPFDFIHPEDAEKTRNSLSKIAIESRVEVAPFRFQNKNGEWRWIETVLTNMLDNPAVNGIVANSRDITAKKKETQHLKLLESVITNTKDAILITEAEPFDEPGPKIVYVNEAFTKMTGYTAEEVIGKTPRILQGPKSDKEALSNLSKALVKWEPYEITTINYKKNGEEFWINFSVIPVADETGWYTHWIAIERNVTEQKNKELENQLIAQISANFDLENDFEKATKELCKAIAFYGKVDWVELWTTNLVNTQMQLTSYYLSNPEDEVIYSSESHVKSFNKDEGLIGKVWVTGEQTLWEDVSQAKDFVRKDISKKVGLKSLLGIPLIFDDKVLGVIAVGVKNNSGYLKNYLNIFKRLEKFIGSELQRKTLEIELSNLFDTISDIISVGDLQGRFLRINKSGCKLLGYSEKEILQKGFEAFIHPEDLNICYQELQQLQNGQDTFSFEVRFLTKSGEILWLSWNCKAKIKEGLIYCTAKNITEEKKLEKLNKQTNDLGKIGTWEYNLIENKLFWSDEVYRLHDLEPGAFVPNVETAIDFYKEEHKSYVTDEITKSLTLGVYLDYEAVIITKSKKEKWVRVVGNPEFIDGKCVKFIGSFQDTTEKRESEMRLQSLSDNLPGVVYQYIIHPDGTDSIQFISGMVEKMWGYTTNEVIQNIDLLWDQIKQGGDIEEVKSSVAKSIETKSKWTCRFKIINSTGEIKTHFGSGTPIFLADGTIIFHVMVLDITQEAKNEELLEEVTKMARIGSWKLDFINQDGDSIYWSPILREIVEVDDNYNPTLTGGIEFHVGESKERIQKAIDVLIADGIEFDEEVLLRTAKGNERWNRCIGKREMVNGKCIRIYGSYQDIHQRKESQLELLAAIKKAQESDARFKSYTQQSPVAIYTTDINGDCIYANKTWLEMAEMQLEDALGKGWINALHPEDLNYVTDNWYKSIESNGEWNYEYRFINSNKNTIWVSGSAKKLFNDKNEHIGYLGSNVNITERKKAEQEKNSLLTTLEKSLNEIYVFDAETLKFSYVNQGALNNIGYSEQEIKELTPLDLKPEFTATTYKQLVNQLVSKEKEKIVFFTNHKRKNGSLYPVEIHLQLVTEGNNKRFLAVILDITNLKETEQLLDSASTLARVGSWELVLQDNEEHKMFWSSMTKNIVEVDESFEPTLDYGINLHKEPSRTLIAAAVNKTIETGEAFDLELELGTSKGNDTWVRCIGDAQIENGKVTRIFGSYQDINSRKLAELNQLKLIEEKNNILESISDYFYAMDGDFNFTYINSSAAQLLGVNKEKIIGKNLFNVFPDLKNTLFEEELIKVQNTAEATKFEYYYSPFDTWFDESIYPTPTGISVYFVDITQRKKATEEIAKSEEKRRLIMNSALDAIISIDTNEKITFWNPQAEIIFGWKAEEVMGKKLSEVIIPESFRKYHVQGIENYLKIGEGKALNVLLELSAIRRNSEEFPIELTVIPIKQGGEEFFCAFIRDITHRKKAEREIKQANERFEKVTEATNDVIWDWDIETGTFFRSNAIDTFFGVGTSKVMDKEDFWKDNFHPEDISKIKSSMEKALEDTTCNRWEEEYRILSNNNEMIFVIDRGLILRNNNGKAIRMVGAMTNITVQKKQEGKLIELNQSLNDQAAELKRSNEELEQFAFVASHDLQEPLRMITSFLDQLKRKYGDRLDEKGLQYIYFATDGAKRMKQIILDLLLYSRANRPTEQNELINLNDIVSEYTQLRRKVIAEKKATINFDELPSFATYRAPITQIFHCLLDNALKYVDEDKAPNIEIEAIEKENVWQFAIKDNGIGIDSKFYDKIFIIFQRLQNRKEHDGTGIGLAIAKRSIEFLGGTIWVESEKDKGSTFHFTILKIKQLI